MSKIKTYYKNVFLYSSLQTSSNIEKYFTNHTEKLVVFVINSRQQPNTNLLRVYIKGSLIKEKKIILASNIFLFYLFWYLNHIYILITYFKKKEKVFVMITHPVCLFGMSVQKMLRNIQFFYWDGDYFPPVKVSLILFERLKKHYIAKVDYAFYQSDVINEKMNGKVMNTPYRKTVMLGVLSRKIERKLDKHKFTILFIGVIRESQGLEFLFEFLKRNKDYYLKIIGMSTNNLYKKYMAIIKKNKIDQQIYFPNRFFSDSELDEISKDCRVGIAVYDMDQTNATYYTDPGKVKTYASLGLPIIMSDVSAIAPFVKKFGCGIVIQKEMSELGDALIEIKKNYKKYLNGLIRFNKYFYYETYYRKGFNFKIN